MELSFDLLSDKLLPFIFQSGAKLISALLIWVVGSSLIRLLVHFLTRILERVKLVLSLHFFLISFISVGLKILSTISAWSTHRIEINLKQIQNFRTVLSSPESRTIILPNGPLANNDLVNFTTEGKLRVDLEFGINYGDSIEKAKKVLLTLMEKHPKVLEDPAPFGGVTSLGDSSVNLAVRPHCHPEDYWEVYFDLYEEGKNSLDVHHIEIPFPQRVVHQKSV